MKRLLPALALLLAVHARAAAPVVSNIRAAQIPGTKQVEVLYDVSDADGDALTIGLEISGDGGLTYTIPATALSGQAGPGIAPGSNRRLVWNAGTDWNNQYVPNARARVTAYDGTTPVPPAGMVYLPAGSFQMGDNLDGITDALPTHIVAVNTFFMDRFEVPKELYQSVQAWSNGHGYSISVGGFKAAGHPVQGVTWYDAVKWCNARSEKEGLTPCYYTDDAQTIIYKTSTLDLSNAKVKWTANGYRLPTEAGWEKAARGGSFGLRYPWGNSITGSQANYSGSGDPFDNQFPGTTLVGYYNGAQTPAGIDMANGYSLYDMAGNVQEWCWDWYDSAYYGNVSANTNPHGPATASGYRVFRGGSWLQQLSLLRCANRSADLPNLSDNAVNYTHSGFRCVRGL